MTDKVYSDNEYVQKDLDSSFEDRVNELKSMYVGINKREFLAKRYSPITKKEENVPIYFVSVESHPIHSTSVCFVSLEEALKAANIVSEYLNIPLKENT